MRHCLKVTTAVLCFEGCNYPGDEGERHLLLSDPGDARQDADFTSNVCLLPWKNLGIDSSLIVSPVPKMDCADM